MIQAIRQSDTLPRDDLMVDLLGDDIELWIFEREWKRAGASLGRPMAAGDCLLLQGLIESAFDSSAPAFDLISRSTVAVVVPLPERRPAAAAVSYFSADQHNLLALTRRIASGLWSRQQVVLRQQKLISQQEAQLSSFASQISAEQEELVWLRQLACNLELSESGNSTEHIAESVLPSLCQLIRAESVIFVRDVALDSADLELPTIWQTGPAQLSRSTVLLLVSELSQPVSDRPVVMNNWHSSHPVTHCDSGMAGRVNSCLLVPVATGSTRLGWLVAINKHARTTSTSTCTAASLQTGSPRHLDLLRDAEFGTFEASLMNATAVILAAHGKNCSLFREKELLLKGVIRSMINAIDAKDSYTCGHSDRVAEFARMIAQELKLPTEECERIHMTGLLHDVGKIGVPDEVLNKPGRLTESEFEQIKQHPVIGYEILKHLENLDYVLPGVLHHHEAVDGSGYPNGLVGEAIPLEAKILAVADAYDAMTSNRPYRRGMPSAKAEQILREGINRQWDADCVAAFFRTIDSVRKLVSQQSTQPLPIPIFTSSGADHFGGEF